MQGKLARWLGTAVVGLLPLSAAGLALTASPASAATVFPASTTITNDYDSGGQGYWANDDFTRSLNFTQEDASYCESEFGTTSFPAGEVCYEATISDSGTFTTLLNAYQPNQGFTTDSNKTILNVVNGTFTGTDSWAIETATTDEPDPTLVTATLNDDYTHPSSGKDSTSGWYLQAFATAPAGVEGSNWSWTYNTSCESWTDSSASGAGNNGFDGQSSPTSVDGNITGETGCTPDVVTVANPGTETTDVGSGVSVQLSASSSKGDAITSYSATGLPAGLSISSSGLISGTVTTDETTTVTVTATDSAGTTGSASFTWVVQSPVVTSPPPLSSYGDEVNNFGNGFDVYRQKADVGTIIAGWPATQADSATHFIRNPEGSDFQFEYAPKGVGDGLCVSNPGDNALVLRACNPNVWQKFAVSGKYLVSVVTGGYVNPDGTGGQLTVGSSPVAWGGSAYSWVPFTSLP
jgi:Putative Ig domain